MTFPEIVGVGDKAVTGPWMVLTVDWFFVQFFERWKNLSHVACVFRYDFVEVEEFGTVTSGTLAITNGSCFLLGYDKI